MGSSGRKPVCQVITPVLRGGLVLALALVTVAQAVVPAVASFNSAINSAGGTAPVAVATGDFNGDGGPDLALADYGSDKVSILKGNGDGTFTIGSSYPVGKQPRAIVAADFNHDGKLDLAVANAGSKSVSILIGLGNGSFMYAPTLNTSNSPVALAVGDFNGDGKVDLAVANQGSNSVSIFLGAAIGGT
ncbi:MAG: VCBS repeat-containing protein, partial [Chloroflexi bacterium]